MRVRRAQRTRLLQYVLQAATVFLVMILVRCVTLVCTARRLGCQRMHAVDSVPLVDMVQRLVRHRQTAQVPALRDTAARLVLLL